MWLQKFLAALPNNVVSEDVKLNFVKWAENLTLGSDDTINSVSVRYAYDTNVYINL